MPNNSCPARRGGLRSHRRGEPARHAGRGGAAGAARPLDRAARDGGATEDQLRQIAAEAPGEVYFRDSGRRAHGLEMELTGFLDLGFKL